jgi:transposase
MVTTFENIDYKDRLEKALLTIESQQRTIESQQFTIQGLQMELLLLRKMLFGSRHEKFQAVADPNAPTLFDITAIAEVVTSTTEAVIQKSVTTRLQPNHKGRNEFPEKLRREVQIIHPAGIDPATAKKLGEDVTEILAYQPGELYVKKVVRTKFMDSATNKIVQAPAPDRTFERSSFDTSLATQITVEKFVDHLPLHRQISRYSRLGVTISDSTIGDCLTSVAGVITPLYEAHKQLVLSCRYLHADETTIKVLDKQKKGTTHLGYYWVYQSHDDKLVLFDYQTGRGREGPQTILKNYQGYLQTDGYAGYEYFGDQPGITLVGCLAHARRKFSEAISNNKDIATHVLTEIQKIYAIERHLADNEITGTDKLQYRQQNAVPILTALGSWMQDAYTKVLPASAIGKALFYSLSRWEKLSLYATTSILGADNNPVENSIRPVAIGRKNYMFAGSHAAAQRAAMFYSLFATCKNHHINPCNWLHDVLNRIAAHPINRINELLPQNWKPNTVI